MSDYYMDKIKCSICEVEIEYLRDREVDLPQWYELPKNWKCHTKNNQWTVECPTCRVMHKSADVLKEVFGDVLVNDNTISQFKELVQLAVYKVIPVTNDHDLELNKFENSNKEE